MRIIKQANQIFVTSQNWKNLLTNRISAAKSKTKVLTNAYPLYEFIESSSASESEDNNRNIRLLHAGKFVGTRYSNTVDLLLRPFLDHIEYFTDEIEITLLGNLRRKDLYELKRWFNYFQNSKCKILHKSRVPRTKMFDYILSNDGLLLLAASQAFIPSKTFEYIKSKKPILAVTLKNSSVWNMAKDVPQMFVYDYNSSTKDYDTIERFLSACRTGKFEINVPNQYSEEHLSKVFLRSIEDCIK